MQTLFALGGWVAVFILIGVIIALVVAAPLVAVWVFGLLGILLWPRRVRTSMDEEDGE